MVIASDERWLRILELTLRLGGLRPILRRSFAAAQRTRVEDARPGAVIIDLDNDSTPAEMVAARRLQDEMRAPVIVILPEVLAGQAQVFHDNGLRVVSRPYPPSALYAALRSAARPS
jgi:hypothetical protein